MQLELASIVIVTHTTRAHSHIDIGAHMHVYTHTRTRARAHTHTLSQDPGLVQLELAPNGVVTDIYPDIVSAFPLCVYVHARGEGPHAVPNG